MIQYLTPGIENMETYKSLLKYKFFDPDNFDKVWRRYLTVAVKGNRIIGEPKLRKKIGEIDVMGVRNNPEISFNFGDTFNNDLLIIRRQSQMGPLFFLFKVTMDPKGKQNKIAHLLEGIYASYTALRPHLHIPGRTAIVQDRNKVFVARTDTKGKILINEEKNFFGINIHDASRFKNSSLGCTILEMDSNENGYHYEKHFKPLIKSITNKEEIDYTVINKNVLLELANIESKKGFDIEYILKFLAFDGFSAWRYSNV